ncbi:MAG: FAD-dependent monooxygenase, partial [Pedosphaera parvula]|nr:FAD-dependent monooxygenase [Pedosphaera parvula]
MNRAKPITIVGGGLAGLTLGIALRARGVPVSVWEAGAYPRHRVCGEFLCGRGLDSLARLGLLEPVLRTGVRTADTVQFFSGTLSSGSRPIPRAAFCLSRYVLDDCLAQAFRQHGGTLLEQARWTEGFEQEGLVRATGRRLCPTDTGWRWIGLKAHARNVPLAADLEMHFVAGGYVGLARLPNREINVCALFRAKKPLP